MNENKTVISDEMDCEIIKDISEDIVDNNVEDIVEDNTNVEDNTKDNTEDNVEDYLYKFTNINNLEKVIDLAENAINNSEHDQARIQSLIKYSKLLRKQNNLLYDLVISIHNKIN